MSLVVLVKRLYEQPLGIYKHPNHFLMMRTRVDSLTYLVEYSQTTCLESVTKQHPSANCVTDKLYLVLVEHLRMKFHKI